MDNQDELFSATARLLDPLQLQRFLAVFDLGNFARAAEATHVTQQAISKSIARLEEQCGAKLFERGAFGAEPTEYGKALARRAKIIVTESRLAQAELNALKGAAGGLIRVGFGWSFLPRIAPLVINRFRKRRPNVTLSIVSGQSASLFKRLADGDVEFVASAPPPGIVIDEALEATGLFQDSDVVVMRANHPLSESPIITLKDLAEQTWAISLALHEQWRTISQVFVAAGQTPPQKIIDLDSPTLCKAMVTSGDCIAILGREQAAAELESGAFKALERPDFQFLRNACYVVRRGAIAQPSASLLKQDLFDVCREFYA